MTTYMPIEESLTNILGLTRRPVAVAFRDAPPPGVAKFSGQEPSGCSFWRLAAAGRVFYTVASDHHHCAIGSHTHNLPLSAERAAELDQTLGLMTGIGYLRREEVAAIPQLPQTPGAVVYAPLGATPVEPDVVMVVGLPGRVMLLQEAAMRAGVGGPMPGLGRPTCMALPAALTQRVVVSTGCIGNRVYTGIGEDELYIVVAGQDLAAVAAEAETIASANAKLRAYHLERRRTLSTE